MWNKSSAHLINARFKKLVTINPKPGLHVEFIMDFGLETKVAVFSYIHRFTPKNRANSSKCYMLSLIKDRPDFLENSRFTNLAPIA